MTDDTRETLLSLPIGAPLSGPGAGPQADLPAVFARLIEVHAADRVDGEGIEAWSKAAGHRILVLAGDPVRHPEGLDVAVVLPEVRRQSAIPFVIGLASRTDQDAIARRFGVTRWPNLVFLRDGDYLGALPGMLDWEPFCAEVARLLAGPARRPPTVGIPVVAAGLAGSGEGAECR